MQERARAEALTEIAGVGSSFPAVRACSPEFDAWAEGRCICSVTPDLLIEGMASLPASERAQIVARGQAEAPQLWQRARHHAATDEHIANAVLSGAVAGALAERCLPSLDLLAILDEQGRRDEETPAELLALVLDADHVWSVREAAIVDGALAALDTDLDEDAYARAWDATVAREAARLVTDEHRDRLARLVRRLHASLPFPGFAVVSELVGEACAEFERDPAVRGELALWLLGDAACLAPPRGIVLAA
jgi:hypothetical protein